jgi:hypothetical protein
MHLANGIFSLFFLLFLGIVLILSGMVENFKKEKKGLCCRMPQTQ